MVCVFYFFFFYCLWLRQWWSHLVYPIQTDIQFPSVNRRFCSFFSFSFCSILLLVEIQLELSVHRLVGWLAFVYRAGYLSDTRRAHNWICNTAFWYAVESHESLVKFVPLLSFWRHICICSRCALFLPINQFDQFLRSSFISQSFFRHAI